MGVTNEKLSISRLFSRMLHKPDLASTVHGAGQTRYLARRKTILCQAIGYGCLCALALSPLEQKLAAWD